MIDLKEAQERRLEKARKVLGFSKSYLTLQRYPLKENEEDLSLKYLDRIMFGNSQDKKQPILTFEDNSHVLFFPFYIYRDRVFDRSEQDRNESSDLRSPGYFFVGSIKYPTQLERVFFQIGPDGREQLLSMMKEFYSYKKQSVNEGKIILGNYVASELSRGIEDSKRQINEILEFREDSKKAKSKRQKTEYSGNRINQKKKRENYWIPREVSMDAYYRKQMDAFLEWFYAERISFSHSVIDSTRKNREKIQEQRKQNPLLFERIKKVMFDSYLKIIQREGKLMGNDHAIIAETIFYALMNQEQTGGKVNIVSSDHHFREIPDYIQHNKTHFYNSKIRNFLIDKNLELVIHKSSPVLATSKTEEDIKKENLVTPVVKIVLKKEDRNIILERRVI